MDEGQRSGQRTFTPLFDGVVSRHGMVAAAVYGAIWRYCQLRNGVCYASLASLAARLGLNRSTVQRQIARLIEAGLLEDRTPGLRNRPHVYRALPLTSWAEMEAEEVEEDVVDQEEEVGEAYGNRGREEGEGGAAVGLGRGALSNTGRAESGMNQTIRDELSADEEVKAAQILWKKMLEMLSLDFSRGQMQDLFGRVEAGRWDGVTLALWTEVEEVREWIMQRYQKPLERLVMGLTGSDAAKVEVKNL